MATNTIRQKIAEYIHFADEKKVKAIYILLQADIEKHYADIAQKLKTKSKKRI